MLMLNLYSWTFIYICNSEHFSSYFNHIIATISQAYQIRSDDGDNDDEYDDCGCYDDCDDYDDDVIYGADGSDGDDDDDDDDNPSWISDDEWFSCLCKNKTQ